MTQPVSWRGLGAQATSNSARYDVIVPSGGTGGATSCIVAVKPVKVASAALVAAHCTDTMSASGCSVTPLAAPAEFPPKPASPAGSVSCGGAAGGLCVCLPDGLA